MEYFIPRLIERLIIAGCVPLLIVLGYKLFLKGVDGKIGLSVDANSFKGKAANLAPGALCFTLACCLGVWVMSHDLRIERRETNAPDDLAKNRTFNRSPDDAKASTSDRSGVYVVNLALGYTLPRREVSRENLRRARALLLEAAAEYEREHQATSSNS